MDHYQKSKLIREFDGMLKFLAADFLNLLVGENQLAAHFWKTKLTWQVLHSYNYKLPEKKMSEGLPLGLLIDSFVFHSLIELESTSYPKINGNREFPFSGTDIRSFRSRFKTFTFDNHPLKRIVARGNLKDPSRANVNRVFKNLKLKIAIERSLQNVESQQQASLQLCELLLQNKGEENCRKALAMSHESMRLSNPFSPR